MNNVRVNGNPLWSYGERKRTLRLEKKGALIRADEETKQKKRIGKLKKRGGKGGAGWWQEGSCRESRVVVPVRCQNRQILTDLGGTRNIVSGKKLLLRVKKERNL